MKYKLYEWGDDEKISLENFQGRAQWNVFTIGELILEDGNYQYDEFIFEVILQ